MLIAGLFALVLLLLLRIAGSSMVQTVQTFQFVQQVKKNVRPYPYKKELSVNLK